VYIVHAREIRMYLYDVKSSNLARVGYDPQRMLLLVQFRNGRAYEYYDVPEELYSGLVDASEYGGSPGRFFEKFIRRKYEFRETQIG
jgi:hypothetical protein